MDAKPLRCYGWEDSCEETESLTIVKWDDGDHDFYCPKCLAELRADGDFKGEWVEVKDDEANLFIVRHWDGFDCTWMDITGPVSRDEAEWVWNEKTSHGTRFTNFDHIDYYKIFPFAEKVESNVDDTTDASIKLWLVEYHGPSRGAYFLVVADDKQSAINVAKMGRKDHTLSWFATEVDTDILRTEPWHMANRDAKGVFSPPSRQWREGEK